MKHATKGKEKNRTKFTLVIIVAIIATASAVSYPPHPVADVPPGHPQHYFETQAFSLIADAAGRPSWGGPQVLKNEVAAPKRDTKFQVGFLLGWAVGYFGWILLFHVSRLTPKDREFLGEAFAQ